MALLKSGKSDSPAPEKNLYLAQIALEYLTDAEYTKALAEAAKQKLDSKEISAILKSAVSMSELSSEEITAKLSEKTSLALRNITERDYHGVIIDRSKARPKEIIDLGLAVYGDGSEVLAAFGSK
jgi:hypothetical protein